ncbi:CAP domain-containing protein [Streptomyces sp. NPDC001709]
MGRHRRSAAGRAARGRATGGIRAQRSSTGTTGGAEPQDSYAGEPVPRRNAHGSELELRNSYAGELIPWQAPRGIAPYLNPEAYSRSTGHSPMAYADATAKAHAYLFAAEDGGPGGSAGGGFTPAGDSSRGRRRRRKGPRPVRAGLLGVSAAVALGTAAVATGVVPGLQNYKLGGDTHATGGEQLQAAGTPSNTAAEQGGTSGSAGNGAGGGDSRQGGTSASRDTTRPEPPSPSASPTASASASASASPTPTPSKTAAEKPSPRATPSGTPHGSASRAASKAPKAGSAPMAVSKENSAAAQVLTLVNQERAKVGCSPLAANSSLGKLAGSFSDDMAARGFFDHTDPDGKSPWDRAAAAGITDLGGENIARGQADAAAVMEAWMNSPGHRANILNCDFKTLGVGVHFGPGGPWWTQDFGY